MEYLQNLRIDVILYALLLSMAIAIVPIIILFIWVFRRVRYIHVPKDADFFTTLRYTPLSVVILLDLLDFGFDVFAAPISWFLLNRLGLKQLRATSALEGLIPGTQFLPTMTVAWVMARFMR